MSEETCVGCIHAVVCSGYDNKKTGCAHYNAGEVYLLCKTYPTLDVVDDDLVIYDFEAWQCLDAFQSREEADAEADREYKKELQKEDALPVEIEVVRMTVR